MKDVEISKPKKHANKVRWDPKLYKHADKMTGLLRSIRKMNF